MKAYEIELLGRPADRTSGEDHGWCFGLPPGIVPHQWPLDANNGYPLMHGFTLLLPEAYRCHGPDIVALSFFAKAPDHHDGTGYPVVCPDIARVLARTSAGLCAGVDDPDDLDDPDLATLREADAGRHARTVRLSDDLGASYAIILLNSDEYRGPLCFPPTLAPNWRRDALRRPSWLDEGSASAYSRDNHYTALLGRLGFVGRLAPCFQRAFQLVERKHDPNAGIPPREDHASRDTGYRSPWNVRGDRLRPWAKAFTSLHLGGTMNPCQSIPPISPYYIEFPSYLGGYDFGDMGVAQLDFRDMVFDFASH